jgi:hypothetical protein
MATEIVVKITQMVIGEIGDDMNGSGRANIRPSIQTKDIVVAAFMTFKHSDTNK